MGHRYVSYSERLLHAQASGGVALAKDIYDLSLKLWGTTTAFFSEKDPKTKDEMIGEINGVLSRMSKHTIAALIQNRLHTFFHPCSTRPEFCLPTHLEGYSAIPSLLPYSPRPIIYGLVICTPDGELPTGHQLKFAIEKMERYASQIHPFYVGTYTQEELNNEALIIDFWMINKVRRRHKALRIGAQRDLIEGRITQRVIKEQNVLDREEVLKLQKQVQISNLQKYYDTDNFRKATKSRAYIRRWRKIMKSRLDQIPDFEMNSSVHWSILNIGWTSRPDKRRRQHLNQSDHSHRMKK